MIFGKKKKAEAENEASRRVEPAAPPLPTEAPNVADQMQRIDTPQTAAPLPPEMPAHQAPAEGAVLPPAPGQEAPQSDPERDAKVAQARAQLHEAFGKITLAAMSEPRYRNLSINDMAALFLEPLLNNRIAIASPATDDGAPIVDTVSAIAIWASVSSDVDAKIREQIDAGGYPVRLQREDWNSGTINWLIDVIAPSQRLTTAVIANFRQVLTEGEICIHPMVTRTMDREVLEKLGARPIGAPAATE